MKTLIVALSMLLAIACGTANAQTFYKLNKNHTKKMAETGGKSPALSISFTPITYSQLNFITSFDQITINSGKWNVSPTTFSFAPSYVFGSANAKVTATAGGDTIYDISQNVAWGGGLILSDNIVTGKIGVAPSLVGQIGSFWAISAGYDFMNKMGVAGLSGQLGDILNNLHIH